MALTMPTAADLDSSLRLRRTPEPFTAPPRPTTDPQAIGAGEEAVGRDLQQASDVLYRAQQRVDTNRAEDAHTQLVQASMDLNEGQNGFSKLHGAKVVNQPVMDNYTKQFDSKVKAIQAGLANDQQRQMFQRRANITRAQFHQDLLRHIGNEGEQYDKETFEGGVSTEQQNGASHWMNPHDVATSIERINALVNQRADHLGLPADQRKALMVNAISGLHRDVINQALTADNFKYASDYFNGVKEQMKEEDREAVRAPMQLVGAQFTADQLITKYGTGGAAIEAANHLPDPVLKEKVMDAIERRASVNERLKNEGERNVRESMSRKLEASDPTLPLEHVFSAKEISSMSTQPGLVEMMQNRQKARLEGTEVQTDPRVLDRYRTLMGKDHNAFMQADITKDYQHLSIRDRDYLENSQKEIADPKKAPKYATESQILDQAYYEIGADKLTSQTKEQLQGQFFNAYKNEVQAFVDQNKRDPNADEMRQITKRLQLPFVQAHPEWYKSDANEALFKLDPKNGGSLQIPTDVRQHIITSYQRVHNGAAPTEDQIRLAYLTVGTQ